VFRSRKAAVFVHGCFWHRHDDPGCKLARMPKSRLEFWQPKLSANRDRDERNLALLRALGWTVIVVWECELASPERLRDVVDEIRAHLKVCALKHALRYEPRTVAKLRDRACRLDRSMA